MQFRTNSGLPGTKAKRQKFGVGSLIFLVIFGAIFTGVGVFAVKSMQIDSSWTRVKGAVSGSNANTSDGSTTYSPVVDYQVNGQNYHVSSSISSSSYPTVGSSREVAYNPAHPEQAKLVEGVGGMAFIFLFPAIGILCLVLGPVMFIRSLKRSGKINELIQNGTKVVGVLVDVQANGGNNTSSDYKIVVSAVNAQGVVQNYTSDNLTGIGGLAMSDFRNTPIPIDVYIDRTNPDNYYVDVSDIPNLTPERIANLLRNAISRPAGTSIVPQPPQAVPTAQNLLPPQNPSPPVN